MSLEKNSFYMDKHILKHFGLTPKEYLALEQIAFNTAKFGYFPLSITELCKITLISRTYIYKIINKLKEINFLQEKKGKLAASTFYTDLKEQYFKISHGLDKKRAARNVRCALANCESEVKAKVKMQRCVQHDRRRIASQAVAMTGASNKNALDNIASSQKQHKKQAVSISPLTIKNAHKKDKNAHKKDTLYYMYTDTHLCVSKETHNKYILQILEKFDRAEVTNLLNKFVTSLTSTTNLTLDKKEIDLTREIFKNNNKQLIENGIFGDLRGKIQGCVQHGRRPLLTSWIASPAARNDGGGGCGLQRSARNDGGEIRNDKNGARKDSSPAKQVQNDKRWEIRNDVAEKDAMTLITSLQAKSGIFQLDSNLELFLRELREKLAKNKNFLQTIPLNLDLHEAIKHFDSLKTCIKRFYEVLKSMLSQIHSHAKKQEIAQKQEELKQFYSKHKEVINQYFRYRMQRKNPLNNYAKKALILELKALEKRGYKPKQCVEQSLNRGYNWVFPLTHKTRFYKRKTA